MTLFPLQPFPCNEQSWRVGLLMMIRRCNALFGFSIADVITNLKKSLTALTTPFQSNGRFVTSWWTLRIFQDAILICARDFSSDPVNNNFGSQPPPARPPKNPLLYKDERKIAFVLRRQTPWLSAFFVGLELRAPGPEDGSARELIPCASFNIWIYRDFRCGSCPIISGFNGTIIVPVRCETCKTSALENYKITDCFTTSRN
jgi:hypothetical protein